MNKSMYKHIDSEIEFPSRDQKDIIPYSVRCPKRMTFFTDQLGLRLFQKLPSAKFIFFFHTLF